MPDNDDPLPQVDNFSELGATGLWRTGGFVIDDILPQLRGRQSLTAYRDMAENDPIIGAILFSVERVILQVDWRVDPYTDPTGETPLEQDDLAAQFVQECMDDMSHSWHELMIAIVSFLTYGWSYFEIVYKQRKGPQQKDPSLRSKFNDNKIGWRKIAMRAQDSLWQWQFDESGGIKAMIQRDPTTGRLNVIPIEKGLLFRTTSARGNPEGRALDPSTPIPSPDGWTTMGELRVGSRIFDEKGDIRHVTAVANWDDRPRYRLHFSDGTSIVADANHEWYTTLVWERSKGAPAKKRTTQAIVDTIKNSNGVSNHAIARTAPLRYASQCLPIHPYLLGLWLGDGSSRSAVIYTNRADAKEQMGRVASLGYEVSEIKSSLSDKEGCRFNVYSGLQASLREANLLQNKHLPEAYLRGSVEQRLELLAGLIDSDGHMDRYGRCEFSNVNENLIQGFAELARSLGIDARVSVRRLPGHDGRGMGRSLTWVVRFKSPEQLPILQRKRDRIEPNRARDLHYIVSAEKLENGPTVCIEVDSPSHMFLAGDGMMPSHNSILRNSFKSWYYKRRIEEFEAVGVERDLAGLPVGYVPAEWMSASATPAEKQSLWAMERIVRGVKRNETEGVILPMMFDENGKQLVDFKLLNSGGARQFNAQPLDAKVLTPNGWKLMGDMQVGDEVIDPLGYPSKVLGVFPKGVRPVYEVTLVDGRKTKADAEHNWVVTNSKWRSRQTTNGHPLLPQYKVLRTAEIAERMNGRYRFHVPLMEAAEFSVNEMLPVDPYVLGVLLGDGNLREVGGVRFYSADPEIAAEVETHLPMGDIVTSWDDPTNASGKALMYNVTGTSGRRTSATKNALSEMGLLGKKSSTKFIPEKYLRASVKDRLALLQGLVDTDGTVSKADGVVIFYTVSPLLAEGVTDLVRSLGGTASVGCYPIGEYTSPKTGKVGVSENDYYHVRIRMPNHLPAARLERKASLLKSDDRSRYGTGIASIEYVGDEPVQCILVSSPSHMYVTDDFIPTHNTDQIITRYNQQIAMTCLADFIMLGHESVGSFALGASKVDLFMAAVESWVRLIAEVFNSHAIPRLMTLNGFDTERCPNLTYGQVNAVDLVELGTFLLNLSQAQLLTPDNTLEDYLRELAGLPTFHPEPDGLAENVRYGGNQIAPDPAMQDQKPDFVATNTGGRSSTPSTNTNPTGIKNPQGGVNDQSGGSGIQADISSQGYPGQTGEVPPSARGGNTKPTGANGPLTNNQGTTS